MQANKKKWLGLLLFALPLLLLLTGVNYLADPGNLFHYFYDDLTDAIIQGEEVQILSNNCDEREVSRLLIEKMPQELDCIVLGPSLALTIGKEMTGTDTFYNLAMSAADYYDLLAMVALMELGEKKVNRIIICYDSRLFDDNVLQSDGRHDKLMNYSLYMEKRLKGESVQAPAKISEVTALSNFPQLFSVSYFQYSVNYLKTNGLNALKTTRWQVAKPNSTDSRYLSDYSMMYGLDQEAITSEQVVDASRIYWLESNVTEYAHPNPDKMAMFEALVRHLQQQGTQVDLFLCPFAPALWDRIQPDHYPILFEMEEEAGKLADKYNLKVIGSYNPYIVGLTNEHFYDSRHVKRNALKEFFDFMD